MPHFIRSAFCGIDTVSCVTGLSTNRIYDLVESGDYLWVWNISSGLGKRRELRFWSREINNPAAVSKMTIDAVIQAIIPNRSRLPGQADGIGNWEFRHLLRLSKPCHCLLRKELGVCGTVRNFFIPRASLEQFFHRRWVGTLKSSQSKPILAENNN